MEPDIEKVPVKQKEEKRRKFFMPREKRQRRESVQVQEKLRIAQ